MPKMRGVQRGKIRNRIKWKENPRGPIGRDEEGRANKGLGKSLRDRSKYDGKGRKKEE